MKKFFILCLMAFMACMSASGQYYKDDSIMSQIQSATSQRLKNKDYQKVQDFALKSGSTFHFEYEPTMYAKGVKNQRKGCDILLCSSIIYTTTYGVFNIMKNQEIIDFDGYYNAMVVASCVASIFDIVGLCYIAVGSRQKNKSAIMVSPNGVRFVF